jgi:hypothetical protein
LQEIIIRTPKYAKINQNKVVLTLLISNKVGFKTRITNGNRFIMIKGPLDK